MRTYVAEIISKEDKKVELSGWVHGRRDHGQLIFIDLRDQSGVTQLVFGSEIAAASELRLEYVIQVSGTVKKRPAGMVNKNILTGNYEVAVSNLKIINRAEPMPLAVDTNGYEIGEETRMRYRYLDLRRERLRNNLATRHLVVKFFRDYLSEKGFIEVETPILSKSTPEGARDYLVPSRIQKGKFYALPQSPQQYKQLLMVAGLEKYFQIARCFRDEDTRGDRQPEFTQLDIEMSFTNQNEIIDLIEDLYIALIQKLFPRKKLHLVNGKFPRLKYDEALTRYGVDKPDLREDKNDPDELAFLFVTDFPMFEKKEDGTLGAVHHPFTLPTTDSLADSENLQKETTEEYKMLMKILDSEKESLKLRSYQHDLVLNGYEIGGGSIRVHNKNLLLKIFERLGNKIEDIEKEFGHLLESFTYGAPPHGGIAPGIDRLVMILQNEPNIREVIAFPKTGDGRDLMMDTPTRINKKQLDELGLKIGK